MPSPSATRRGADEREGGGVALESTSNGTYGSSSAPDEATIVSAMEPEAWGDEGKPTS